MFYKKPKFHLAVDPGSTHMGRKDYIKEIIDRCVGIADSVKFQLFANKPTYTQSGNIYLDPRLFDYAYECGVKAGIAVTASVFGDIESLVLSRYDVPYVKLAYSMKDNHAIANQWIKRGTKVVITSDIMTRHLVSSHPSITHLYTATMDGKTLYPCPFQIDFDGVFPLYNGFSDHTLGVEQAKVAIEYGATWIEKHITLEHRDITCPDVRFALPLSKLQGLR